MKAHTLLKSLLPALAGSSMILASLGARAQEAGEAAPRTSESAAPPAPPAAEVSKAVEPPPAPSRLNVEFYGALLPFLEHVSTSGATPAGFTGGASQVSDSVYTGVNQPPRFRMTSGTS